MGTKKSSNTKLNLGYLLKILVDYRSVLVVALVGFIVGVLWFTGMRFFLIKTTETHYHANFALFINGEREQFTSFTYYEEVAACSSAYSDNPKGRAHMHNQVNDVIHVHDKRVTYGHFFSNIGWTVGDEVLATDTAVYLSNETAKLTYLLNGKEVERIDNLLIGNADRLLVTYGNPDDAQSQFESVAKTASEVNKFKDPAGCGGLNGARYDTLMARLKRATFWSE